VNVPQNPVKSEATGEPTVVEFRGKEYAVPAAEDWPVAALEAFEDGKVAATIRALFPDQWAALKKDAPRVRDLGEFANLIAEAIGAGN
jgi:hypothetical protein